jgi:hypothetical protein
VIMEVAREQNADLIVVGARGSPGSNASCSEACRASSPTTHPQAVELIRYADACAGVVRRGGPRV